ncbi:oxaloacetate decarboxylase, gamma subunit [Allochromatium warmingii]|uniref:Probable oxaloacetate decarboxylase gamma chain n=1 Tax=Allochromatium warmingii TaxID=61595 RepID=A0A1H3HSE9_ALLWA|nr:OadG family transporter subunit [Allochromatium warmingii]SDY18350.1 oxaloacetate decarboxylase, gamma subunit [Allochromatium warmingii]
MTDSTLLLESVMLMLIGMGIVFSFLLLLVGIVRLMSVLLQRFVPVIPAPQSPASAPLTSAIADDLIAVIAAAIARYRSRH